MADRRSPEAGLLRLVGVVVGLVAVVGPVGAQDIPEAGVLTGFVLDARSGRPVPDAAVSIPARSMEVLTDENGVFELTDLPAGAHILRVRKFGYLDRDLMISIGPSRRTVQLGLEPAPFGLEGLTVAVDGVGAITGSVVEAGSGDPVPGVVVWLPAVGRGEPADGSGRFLVPEVPYGPQVLQVMRAGYRTLLTPVVHGPASGLIEIVLEPDHRILSALPVISNRLRGRRNAYPAIVTTHDTERLTRSGAGDVREYIHKHTLVNVIPCSGSAKSFWCVAVGGDAVEPQVCVDGWLEWGGLDVLQGMGPNELHLLEVYEANGRIIRAYTHGYMESLAVGVDGVVGQEPTPQREGVDGVGWTSSRSGVETPMGMRC